MNGTSGKSAAKDVGNWENNSEINPAVNSPVTEDSQGRLGDEENGQESWRGGETERGISAGTVDINESESGSASDPGRTPGKAEGVEDAERRGNQER